eukprot:g5100.t1
MEESEVKDGSILQFDQAKVGGTRVVTGAMLIAKNTSFSVMEKFGNEFFQNDKNNMPNGGVYTNDVEAIGIRCKKLFESVNPKKLDPKYFSFQIDSIKYQIFNVSSERITAISLNRILNILIEHLPSGYAIFQCKAPNQISDLIATVSHWVMLQRR